ncbi:hypothetical protein SM139_0898, partial [Stenotrophomonas maltophilia]
PVVPAHAGARLAWPLAGASTHVAPATRYCERVRSASASTAHRRSHCLPHWNMATPRCRSSSCKPAVSTTCPCSVTSARSATSTCAWPRACASMARALRAWAWPWMPGYRLGCD